MNSQNSESTITTEQPSNNITRYVFVPDLVSYPAFFQFFIVLFVFLLSMIIYIYVSSYDSAYSPNLSMFVDFFLERTTESQKRFELYIHDLVNEMTHKHYEGFTSGEAPQQPQPIFNRFRDFINKQITNTFYVKKNTIHFNG